MTWNAAGGEGVYVAEDRLAAPLNLTVAVGGVAGQMNASLSTAGYYYVFKKHVDLSVSWDSQPQATALTACADTYVVENDTSSHGGEIRIAANAGPPEEVGFIGFNLSAVPAGAWILSARLDVFELSLLGGSENCTVHRVTGNWSGQSLNWSNMPSWTSAASASRVVSQARMWLSFDVTSDVRCWCNASSPNYGFALLSDNGQLTVCSRENATLPPSLEVSYLNGSGDVTVSAYDEARQGPAQVNVDFTVNGAVNANGRTNESGLWDRGAWLPSTGGTWSLGAVSNATWEYKSGSTSSVFALGLPTGMVSLDGNVTDVLAGAVVSNFTLSSSGLFNVGGAAVSFCVNGTLNNGTAYSQTGSGTTLSNGTVRFAWTAYNVSTFLVHASFAGDACYAPCDAYALVTVNTLPLSVQFTASPADFAPGSNITLNATIIDPLTNARFTGHNVAVKFSESVSNGTTYAIGTVNSTGGEALLCLTYPGDGNAYAFNATILNCTDGYSTVSNVVSSPVQLTVGYNDTLNSIVMNETAPNRHTIEYWFGDPDKGGMLGLDGRQITRENQRH